MVFAEAAVGGLVDVVTVDVVVVELAVVRVRDRCWVVHPDMSPDITSAATMVKIVIDARLYRFMRSLYPR